MKDAGKDAGRIIKAVAELDAESVLYVVQKKCPIRVARDLALAAAFEQLNTLGVSHAVIESCQQDQEDRKIIRSVLGSTPTLEYRHEPASENNPLLWLPDVHAWAWGRGGTHRQTIEHRVTVVRLK